MDEWTDGWTDCEAVTEKGRQQMRCRQSCAPKQTGPRQALGSELRAAPLLLFLLTGGLLCRWLPDPGAGLGSFYRAWSSVWAAGPCSSGGGTCNCPSPNSRLWMVSPSGPQCGEFAYSAGGWDTLVRRSFIGATTVY